MKIQDLELVILDMDGTLVDSEILWCKSFLSAGKLLSADVTREDYVSTVGIGGKEAYDMMIKILKGSCTPEEFNTEILAQMQEYKKTEKIQLKKGAIEILDFLDKNNIKIALATSTYKKEAYEMLKANDIYDRFDFIICGDDVQNRKPDPEIYNKVCTTLNVKKDKILVVEDSKYGVQSAYNAGLKCIMVIDMVTPTKNEEAITYKILNSLNEVISLLEEPK